MHQPYYGFHQQCHCSQGAPLLLPYSWSWLCPRWGSRRQQQGHLAANAILQHASQSALPSVKRKLTTSAGDWSTAALLNVPWTAWWLARVHASPRAIAAGRALLEGQRHVIPPAEPHATRTAMTGRVIATSLAFQESSKGARTAAKQTARMETKLQPELQCSNGYVSTL